MCFVACILLHSNLCMCVCMCGVCVCVCVLCVCVCVCVVCVWCVCVCGVCVCVCMCVCVYKGNKTDCLSYMPFPSISTYSSCPKLVQYDTAG